MRTDVRVVALFVLGAFGCGDVVESLDAGDEGNESDAPPDDVVPDDLSSRYAEARCAARSRCECAHVTFDEVACLEHFRGLLETEIDALEAPLYSSSCFEEVISFYDSADCRVAAEVGVPGRPLCRLFAGAASGSCTALNGFAFTGSDCPVGRECSLAGSCVESPTDALTPRELGEPCDPLVGAVCESSLYCDATEGVCAPRPARGQICTQENACDIQDYCAGLGSGPTGSCEARLAIDDSCDPLDGQYACSQLCLDDGLHCQSISCLDGVCAAPEPHVCAETLLAIPSQAFLGSVGNG